MSEPRPDRDRSAAGPKRQVGCPVEPVYVPGRGWVIWIDSGSGAGYEVRVPAKD